MKADKSLSKLSLILLLVAASMSAQTITISKAVPDAAAEGTRSSQRSTRGANHLHLNIHNNSDKIIFIPTVDVDHNESPLAISIQDGSGNTVSRRERAIVSPKAPQQKSLPDEVENLPVGGTHGVGIPPNKDLDIDLDLGALYVLNVSGSYTVQIHLKQQSGKITATSNRLAIVAE